MLKAGRPDRSLPLQTIAMNRKQLVVLRLMAVLLSVLSTYQGLKEESLLFTAAIPVVLVGSVLLLQFADPPINSSQDPGLGRAFLAVGLLGGGILSYQA